ncbi:protein-L-isoaspartate (D-aspartate) O-methyltransferase [Ectocarpus siliculosus]|uniref:protein-L-isoaspartate(D-aspartate) O-methyltransferase n=1 Tax=Ectocarpus siliculosus TaxID=2880 RepID=D7FPW4_ECTSI|nr:protein-L-isoaspartate (D-aspartate) O-methyltransferase [Ectocarpus siliculosus]|eukprot:CBJ48295.1 protein-L-isoaspartate (D-aspartate) O-methyltransferase [Ectocarpus siliculosus]
MKTGNLAVHIVFLLALRLLWTNAFISPHCPSSHQQQSLTHCTALRPLHEASTTLALSPTSRTRGEHQTSSVNVFTPAANGLGLHRKKGDAGGGISSRPATMLGAWRCSGNTNAELVKNLVDSSLVRSARVVKAMETTDRGFYTPQDAYEDRPQPIGFRATISAPHMHAHALEVLSPAIPMDGGRVLDVGVGSGYLAAALSRMVGAGGVVYGLDYIQQLVELSRTNLDKDDSTMLSSGRVVLKTADGWRGWPENGPYDAIHVGAAAESIPMDLVAQLKVGGRMVVPVGPPSETQMLVQVDRVKDTGPVSESFATEGLMSVVYVPLVNSSTTT